MMISGQFQLTHDKCDARQCRSDVSELRNFSLLSSRGTIEFVMLSTTDGMKVFRSQGTGATAVLFTQAVYLR